MAVTVYPAPTPAGTNNIGDVDVLTVPALVAGTANIGDVDVLTLPALPAGTANIGDVDVLTLPALPAGTANIGDVDVLTLPALAAGTNNIGATVVGVHTVGNGTGNINTVRTTQTASVSGTSLVAAPAGSLCIYVTDISVGNSGATLSTITLKDGTTAKFDFPCAPLGGGAVMDLVTPWKLTAATALNYDTSAASTTQYITVCYYVAL